MIRNNRTVDRGKLDDCQRGIRMPILFREGAEVQYSLIFLHTFESLHRFYITSATQ